MKTKACPDCGSTRSRSETGLAKDARCLDCDAPMHTAPLYLKYVGGLVIIVLLVLAGAWIVLAGQNVPERAF